MASSAKILDFFLFCFYISSLQVHARESQYFSKVSPNTNANINANNNANNVAETELLPKKTNSPKKNEEPKPSATLETQNGYGLYGRNRDQRAARFTYSNIPEMTSLDEYNAGENSGYMFNNDNSNNKNNNGRRTKQYDISDTRYQDNGNNYGYETKQTSLNANNGNYYNYNYNKNQYPIQQQGMSDTRFLENGKYFYDLNNEEMYQNRYQPAQQRNDVFMSSRSRGVNSREQYDQGNVENLNEYNNYLEDNQNGQEEYVP